METSPKKGKMIMWCPDCGGDDGLWFRTTEENFKNKCPKCKEFLKKWRCSRCGYSWTPRNFDRIASVCPKCSSPFWNRERVLKK